MDRRKSERSFEYLGKILKIIRQKPTILFSREITKNTGSFTYQSKAHESFWNDIMILAEKEGKGEVLWPLRYALSGREKSPDPFTLLDILGLEESKSRIESAIEMLAG